MDIKDHNANGLGNETPYVARGPARASHDEDSASYIKPIIKELVRTQVCFPNIKLLVDKISTVKVPSATESSGLEAYRMHLTDREKTIQAVVKRRLHKWLTTFNVREGSYVVLKEYNLARGKRLGGEGDVFYLAISDFYSIGEEQRYNRSTDPKSVSASAEEGDSGPQDQVSAKDEDQSNEVDIIRTERSLPRASPTETHEDIASSKDLFFAKSAMAELTKRKRGMAPPDLDPDLISLASKAQRLRETPLAKMTREKEHDNAQPRSTDDHCSSASTPNIPITRPQSAQIRASPEQVPSPLQLSTLASVTGTNATRNKQVNILAMIEYVSNSTVKPTTAPLKRDVRIVDASTDKKVTLSVFVDPVNFIPKEYDIMLFRDLTTHDFSGGNLNAYPKKCRGKEWYILNPYDTEECDMKSMEVFRTKYRKTKAQGPK
ncbi:hypothetical protein HO133_001632 [Letharia lupina]|uniref:Uncharacterized protein n=1 Tax=Letharia lupina TaxID=560253 RepID=A0A8H6CEB1_9LECA|nr:uncharacterized protein HO133_001632 [Letharia lupina]KAF6221664.1 hypothetical protein HO133_001632 [Letharia lupina]